LALAITYSMAGKNGSEEYGNSDGKRRRRQATLKPLAKAKKPSPAKTPTRVTCRISYFKGDETYADNFRHVKKRLEAKFGEKVEVRGKKDPKRGIFKVEILNPGKPQVVHDKDECGYVDTKAKNDKIFKAINHRLNLCSKAGKSSLSTFT